MQLQRLRILGVLALASLVAQGTGLHAQQAEPERIRGEIIEVERGAIVLKTAQGGQMRLGLADGTAVFSLSKARFADVDFGSYVGSVSEKLGDQIYSPIVRDSLSWLHRGFEFRVIDERLRGIAVGHTKWDLTPNSVMTHGWIDDMEGRVVSIKYGPTEEEETDVEVSRDTPVVKMSPGDPSMLKPGVPVFVGAHKTATGDVAAVFIFVGQDGVIPGL